ncbi:MAG TPA: hydantoinase/oxoprolinase family protein [Candidatus Binataceae bacterium]|jgi:N-methylhydantoinase A|nr:hydantoinase/oxoprolinase family protein [Candidatus Binataceae bacterium]
MRDGEDRVGYRIAIDTGGTFTDLVLADEQGNLVLGKSPTTYGRIFGGIEGALKMTAEQLGRGMGDLLAATDLLIYGTTHATNAIIERATARTAFLVTEGFPDVLVLREGGKLDPFNLAYPPAEPYIARRLTFEIRERVDSEGGVVIPLDEAQAREVLRRVDARRVEAVAVCLLWSPANPAHELALGRLIESELPGVPYTLSHQLNPIIREYRRASATAIDASLKPLMQNHLRGMEKDLRAAGFKGQLLVATSFGGVMHVGDVVQRPIYLVKSGPAMAPVAGRTYAEAEAGRRDLIVCDTGGTSFDVSLVHGGMIKFTRETWLGPPFIGHITGMASVDVRSIGAGGGSIAWIDPGGMLRVGPQSARAEPGPACYGAGGVHPTVTDAALVLGYLDPEYFLDGRMRLDARAAETAVGTIASRIGGSVKDAARAIMQIAGDHMVSAIKDITINQGIDPRESLLVAGGGAAGLNILPIARELGCRQVLVPRTAGALSACGGQYSDIVAEFTQSKFAYTGDFPYAEVNRVLAGITAEMDRFESELRERGLRRFRREYFVEARYPYQVWELDVALAKGGFDGPADLDALIEAFHREHDRVFAVKEPGQQLECIYWRGRLSAELEGPPLTKAPARAAALPVPRMRRPAFFAGRGEMETPRYHGDRLAPGMTIDGPAIVDEPTTTIVVYPGSRARVTELHNYLLEVGDA